MSLKHNFHTNSKIKFYWSLYSETLFPAIQVSFSESGSLGNSSGSDVTSLSSQLPDTPNSMVPSPVETWNGAPQTRWSSLLQGQLQHDPGPLHVTSSSHRPNFSGESVFFLSWHAGVGTKKAPIDSDFFFLLEISLTKKLSRTIDAWLDTENDDVQKISRWIYYNKPSPRIKSETFPCWSRWTFFNLMWSYCVLFLQHENFFWYIHFVVQLTLCLKVRAW